MVTSLSSRLGLTRWSAGTDPLRRAQLDADNAKLNTVAVMFGQDLFSARPAAAIAGRFYYATDTGVLYYDNGTAWDGIADLADTATTLAAKADLVAGKVPTSQLPALVITDVFTVASQTAMLALTAERGDVAVRTDVPKTFILATDSPGTLADWKEVPAIGQVQSVAGRTGAVTLAKADVGLSNVDNTSDAGKPVSTATATALAGKAANTQGGAEKVAAGSATTGAVTLDCAVASVFTITPTGDITLAPSNVPAAGTACTITVLITQGATVRTVTMPAGTIWLGSAPAQAANKKCAITMLTVDGGTSWVSSGGVQS